LIDDKVVILIIVVSMIERLIVAVVLAEKRIIAVGMVERWIYSIGWTEEWNQYCCYIVLKLGVLLSDGHWMFDQKKKGKS